MQLLQDAVKNKFERNGLRVLIPSEAQLAIMKGAVLFGHKPDEIGSRIARFSYGNSQYDVFDSDKHDENHKEMLDGRVMAAMCLFLSSFKGKTSRKEHKLNEQCMLVTKHTKP